jgi:5'(3')-deoxyribonucleotidase
MKTILCDVDGVLADFMGEVCLKLAPHGHGYQVDDFRHWDLNETLSVPAQRDLLTILSEPGFCQSLPWYDGAKDFLGELHADGARVYAVTAPFDGSPFWAYERKNWLGPHLDRKRVLSVSGEAKHLVRGDVLIEDHPKTAHDWLQSNRDGIAILVDRPWNGPAAKEWHCHHRMYRVKSYAEALTTIRECT